MLKPRHPCDFDRVCPKNDSGVLYAIIFVDMDYPCGIDCFLFKMGVGR
jgi:hypothetical protein